jgi:hypothetical protein
MPVWALCVLFKHVIISTPIISLVPDFISAFLTLTIKLVFAFNTYYRLFCVARIKKVFIDAACAPVVLLNSLYYNFLFIKHLKSSNLVNYRRAKKFTSNKLPVCLTLGPHGLSLTWKSIYERHAYNWLSLGTPIRASS